MRLASVSSAILLASGVFLALGIVADAAWLLTGNRAWVEVVFRVPGALLMALLALTELWLSVRVLRQYSPGEPMRTAWWPIAFSAGCDLAGTVCVQVLGVESPLNPAPVSAASAFRQFGLVVGGPCRFALLAAGLYLALRVYRRSGFLGRLNALDWAVLGPIAVYIGVEAGGLILAVERGKRTGMGEALNWPVNPLLWVLLVEAMMLYRSVQKMGPGWIGWCWKAFSAAVFLVALGDIGTWATAYGYLPWPWAAAVWSIWVPAGAAFALAPAYQLQAIQYAYSGRTSAADAVA